MNNRHPLFTIFTTVLGNWHSSGRPRVLHSCASLDQFGHQIASSPGLQLSLNYNHGIGLVLELLIAIYVRRWNQKLNLLLYLISLILPTIMQTCPLVASHMYKMDTGDDCF